MARIARGYLWRKENVNTYLKGRKIAAAQDYEHPSMEALRSSANFDGLAWRKKRSGLKCNCVKPRWLAVSSRPRTKPTRRNQFRQMGIAFSQMALPALLLTTSEQRTGS